MVMNSGSPMAPPDLLPDKLGPLIASSIREPVSRYSKPSPILLLGSHTEMVLLPCSTLLGSYSTSSHLSNSSTALMMVATDSSDLMIV